MDEPTDMPQKIYLPPGDDDATWSEEPESRDDIAYYRYDVIDDLQARLTAAEQENARLKQFIESGEAVVNDACNQAEARLHAEVEADRLAKALAECVRFIEIIEIGTVPDDIREALAAHEARKAGEK